MFKFVHLSLYLCDVLGVNWGARWSFMDPSAASFTPCVILVLLVVFHIVTRRAFYHHASISLRLHCNTDWPHSFIIPVATLL
jgi:hypothetical protein